MPGNLGAHVSTAGGVDRAPARGAAIGADVIQLFTKTPSQWREPTLHRETIARFKREVTRHGIHAVVSHDSYLINLASPDGALRARSVASFTRELARCRDLAIRIVVTHPGNFMSGGAQGGLTRNADAYTTCLDAIPGPRIAIETTAGTGSALGARFEELAALRAAVPARLRRRIGYCADTCHLYSAGYDLVNDWDGVWREWDRVLGLRRLWVMHLNDSKTAFGSRRDRHQWIAEGTLGAEPFRRIMRDPGFRHVVKVIETPKGDDAVRHDRRMLRRLRAYARGRRSSRA